MKIVTLSLLIFVLLSGCKARESDESGLLDSESDQSRLESVSAEGAYRLNCSNDSNIGDDKTAETYIFSVKGAADPADESQPLLVSVEAVGKGISSNLFTDINGRGAVSLGKSIFVGFEKGVLTGEPTGIENPAFFSGIMTIAGLTEGLQVSCLVSVVKSDQG